MNTMLRTTVLALSLCLGLAANALAEKVDRNFHERYDVEPGTRLDLRHGDGDVVITPWDESAVEVDVRYTVEYTRIGIGSDPDLKVDFEHRDKVVKVTARESGAGGVGFFSMNQVEYVYRIKAPRWVILDLQGDDGDVEIEDWQADVVLTSDDGDVRLRKVRGAVRLELQDGDVDVDELDGSLDLRIDDGDVTVTDCRGGRVKIDAQDGEIRVDRCAADVEIFTDDGDIEVSELRAAKAEVGTQDGRVELEIAAATGTLDVDVESDDGDVEIELPADVSARYDLYSRDGRVTIEGAGAEAEPGRGRRSTGTLGEGQGEIRVDSGGGRVRLRRASTSG